MSADTRDESARPDEHPFVAAFPALDQAIALAKEYLSTLPSRPVARDITAETLAKALDEPLPERGGRSGGGGGGGV